MPRKSQKSSGRYELRKKNNISLRDDEPLDSNFKALKIADSNSSLFLAKDKVQVGGDLFLEGSIKSPLNLISTEFNMYHPSLSDFFYIRATRFVTEFRISIGTEDLDGSAPNFFSDITIEPDGDLFLEPITQKVKLPSETKLYFDGGSHTYIVESAADILDIYVGGANMLKLTEDSLNTVEVGDSNLILDATFKLILDGDGGTYIIESSDDVLDFYAGGAQFLSLTEGVVDYILCYENTFLATGKKLGFDGDAPAVSHTYIQESSDDVLDFYAGAVNMLKLDETNDKIQFTGGAIELLDTTDNADLFSITIAASGATTIATVDDGAAVGHLTLQPDGDLILDAGSRKVYLPTGDKLYFDGGGDTYITEASADSVRYYVGGDIMMVMDEKGDDGNQINFLTSCVGFTQLEPTYDASITNVDFRHSNKQFVTFGSGNITNLSMYFPLVSGNFQVLIKQDGTGSRTITNYRVYEFDETLADGESAVKFAGGSNPTLTTDANHVDILSFYWDADNEIAYGVATLDFQF